MCNLHQKIKDGIGLECISWEDRTTNEKYVLAQKTKGYLQQAYGSMAEEWIKGFDAQVEYLLDKWKLTIQRQEENSRFGAIFYTVSAEYGDTVLKIIPYFCERMKNEIRCYQKLPYTTMCNMLDYETTVGAILLKYIPGENRQDVEPYLALLKQMREESRLVTAEDMEVTDYWIAWEQSVQYAKMSLESVSWNYQRFMLKCLAQCVKQINHAKQLSKYYVHGDAHVHNIVGDNPLVLIDPIGYKAPFGVEYARFLGTWYRENEIRTDELREMLMTLSTDAEDYRNNCLMLGMDVTFRACNTFSEGNTQSEIYDAIEWADRIWYSIQKILDAE